MNRAQFTNAVNKSNLPPLAKPLIGAVLAMVSEENFNAAVQFGVPMAIALLENRIEDVTALMGEHLTIDTRQKTLGILKQIQGNPLPHGEAVKQ